MKITLAAVGRLRQGPEHDLVVDFADRIRKQGKNLGLTDFDIREVDAPKALSGRERQAREAALLLEATQDATRRIALDEHGRTQSSQKFADDLARWRDESESRLAFYIGGADGHDASLLARTDGKLSLGPMTLPHMLARAVLCEQIYRAMTIWSGHPYHRE
jgi:23S rRNA (pseudouridine1915-N3)-methyltransferase